MEINEELLRRWNAIVAHRPCNPIAKPTPQELEVLKAYKVKVNQFLEELQATNQWAAYRYFSALPERKPSKAPREKKKSQPSQCNSGKPRMHLTPKPNASIRSFQWFPNDTNANNNPQPQQQDDLDRRFTHVIPFLSHKTRKTWEQEEDKAIFGGINRCVFSNLFVEPMELPPAIGEEERWMLGHAANYEVAPCTESFYMAAKVQHKCDAEFIMQELGDDSHRVASFGHGGLELTAPQKERLIELGADPGGFLKVEKKHRDKEDEMLWLRGKDGKLPVREEWYSIRVAVFLYLLRIKFGQASPGTEVHETVQSLVQKMRETREFVPLLVEHRIKDSYWGDAGTGTGYNCLGKVLTQILLELAGLSNIAPYPLLDEFHRMRIRVPNNELVDYELQ